MPWSSAFMATLRSGGPIEWEVTRQRWSGTPGASTDTATSYHTPSARPALSVLPAVSGASVNVPTWASNRGRFSFGIAGTANGVWAASDMPRGALCQVAAVVPGGAIGGDIVARGRVNDLSGVGPISVVDCWDLTAALMTRPAWFSSSDAVLFHNANDAGNVDTLASAYTPGDSLLSLTAAPTVERETGGAGAVLITPSGGGTPFVLRYTGTGATSLTGVSGGILETTATAAAAGSTVQEVAFIESHPIVAALKILTSTGTGANGTYDTLPASWGFGAPLALVDVAGALVWANIIDPASGNHDVRVWSTTTQDQGLSWLLQVLSSYGIWPAMSHGEITFRAAIDRTTTTPPIVMTLNRDNVLPTLPQRRVWDAGVPVEYAQVQASSTIGGTTYSQTSTLSPPLTRPAAPRLDLDFTGGVYQNEAAVLKVLADRLAAWQTRIPSVVQLQATLEAAQLCPGDWVTLDLDGAWTPSNVSSAAANAMVSSVVIDWNRGAVTLGLHITGPV